MMRSRPASASRRRVEAGVVGEQPAALVDHHHLVDHVVQLRGPAELGEQGRAGLRPVEGGDADGRPRRCGRRGGAGHAPLGGVEHEWLRARDQVEPVPAAVDERGQGQREVLGAHPVEAAAGHPGDGSAGRGTVDDQGAGAGGEHPQGDLADRRETSPVGRREGVEVGGEGGASAGVDAVGPTADHLVGVLVRGQRQGGDVVVDLRLGRVGAVDVQRKHVRVLGDGQHHPCDDVDAARAERGRRGRSLVDGRHRGAGRGSRRVAASRSSSSLSTKVRAEAIATCMSRYR